MLKDTQEKKMLVLVLGLANEIFPLSQERGGVRRLIYGNKCPMNNSHHLGQLVFYDYCEIGRT